MGNSSRKVRENSASIQQEIADNARRQREQAEKVRWAQEIWEQQIREAQRKQREQEQEAELLRQFQALSVEDASDLKCITVNLALIKDFLQNTEYDLWTSKISSNCAYKLLSLPDHSLEYNTVKRSFTKTNKKCYEITEIHKIVNPYLMVQYKLMKSQYVLRNGYVKEKTLFHGTKEINIDSICKYNFDWRLNGEARGHKFGQGVSFTPISNYATHYGDKAYKKVMLVVKVLVSKQCIGNQSTELPADNCDTTTNENEQVFVKYEDNTFYPAYIIYYQGFDNNKKVANKYSGGY